MIVTLVFLVSCGQNTNSTKNTTENTTSLPVNSAVDWNNYNDKLNELYDKLEEIKVLIKDDINYEENKEKIISSLNEFNKKAEELYNTKVSEEDKRIKDKVDEGVKKLTEGAKNAIEGITSNKKEFLEKANEFFKQGVDELNNFLNNGEI